MPGLTRGSFQAERSAIRKFGLDLRARQSGWKRFWRSWRIARKVRRLSVYRGSGVIFAYFPVRGEVDARMIIRAALGTGKVVALPRATGARQLDFYSVGGLDELSSGRYGIPEPAPSPGRRVALARAGLILVPGLAFSFDGNRLGFGGGYYDALLRGTQSRSRHGCALGLGFEFQMHGRLPVLAHDARLDGIVTEKRVLLTGSN